MTAGLSISSSSGESAHCSGLVPAVILVQVCAREAANDSCNEPSLPVIDALCF